MPSIRRKRKMKKFASRRRLLSPSEKSRSINTARLEVQQKRSDLLASMKDDIKHKLQERLKDRSVRKDALKKLIVQVI